VLQQFIVNSNEINQGLSIISHAIAARPVKNIYSGISIETIDEGLLLTATDGEMTIKKIVNAQVAVPGSTVFPAKLFTEVMRKQSIGDIRVNVDDNNTARILSSGSKTSIMGMSDDDFPQIKDITSGQKVKIVSSAFKNAINRVMFAVSTDEARKTLTGILMEIYPKEVRLVSIDGFRLALISIEAENQVPDGREFVSCIIPGRVMNELSKIIPDDDTEIELIYNASHVMVSFKGVRLYTTLLQGEFIDYKAILPQSAQTEMEIERTRFYDALERCSLIAREGKSNLITMDISENGLSMSARAERGDAHEDIPMVFHGNPLKISFNSQYMMDVVRNVEDDQMRMCFQSSVSPCIVRPLEGGKFVFLVLPVRTFD